MRRPGDFSETKESLRELYLAKVAARYRLYGNLNLVKVTYSYFIPFSRADAVTQSVRLNKPLLLAPKFTATNMSKYLQTNKLDNFEFQYLRKNKVYNKGRYSRCRQNYRTGVYMCMYLSVITILGLYYWFYKFSFNFTYLWWLFIAFCGSFFVPKIIKYRLYEPTTLINKFFDFFR